MDTRYSRRFVVGGNETAIFSFDAPKVSEEIDGFYRSLADECERWCEEGVASLSAYRERGCRSVRYSVEITERSRGDAECLLELKVKQGGELLFSEIHRWSPREGIMLAPRKEGNKRRKRAGAPKKIKNIEKSS